ncbi:unnamed protein product [Gordionus sp. m RMFG-2023]|uniref:uncharacterized protein LOC135931722 isoform X2 n=1 Tax=Gordionus sp. m RMFG-2023 TaxID=3053472 RepID=UPI0030E27662
MTEKSSIFNDFDEFNAVVGTLEDEAEETIYPEIDFENDKLTQKESRSTIYNNSVLHNQIILNDENKIVLTIPESNYEDQMILIETDIDQLDNNENTMLSQQQLQNFIGTSDNTFLSLQPEENQIMMNNDSISMLIMENSNQIPTIFPKHSVKNLKINKKSKKNKMLDQNIESNIQKISNSEMNSTVFDPRMFFQGKTIIQRKKKKHIENISTNKRKYNDISTSYLERSLNFLEKCKVKNTKKLCFKLKRIVRNDKWIYKQGFKQLKDILDIRECSFTPLQMKFLRYPSIENLAQIFQPIVSLKHMPDVEITKILKIDDLKVHSKQISHNFDMGKTKAKREPQFLNRTFTSKIDKINHKNKIISKIFCRELTKKSGLTANEVYKDKDIEVTINVKEEKLLKDKGNNDLYEKLVLPCSPQIIQPEVDLESKPDTVQMSIEYSILSNIKNNINNDVTIIDTIVKSEGDVTKKLNESLALSNLKKRVEKLKMMSNESSKIPLILSPTKIENNKLIAANLNTLKEEIEIKSIKIKSEPQHSTETERSDSVTSFKKKEIDAKIAPIHEIKQTLPFESISSSLSRKKQRVATHFTPEPSTVPLVSPAKNNNKSLHEPDQSRIPQSPTQHLDHAVIERLAQCLKERIINILDPSYAENNGLTRDGVRKRCHNLAKQIEVSVKCSSRAPSQCKAKQRALEYNLADPKNKIFFKVLSGEISPADLVKMTQEEISVYRAASYSVTPNKLLHILSSSSRHNRKENFKIPHLTKFPSSRKPQSASDANLPPSSTSTTLLSLIHPAYFTGTLISSTPTKDNKNYSLSYHTSSSTFKKSDENNSFINGVVTGSTNIIKTNYLTHKEEQASIVADSRRLADPRLKKIINPQHPLPKSSTNYTNARNLNQSFVTKNPNSSKDLNQSPSTKILNSSRNLNQSSADRNLNSFRNLSQSFPTNPSNSTINSNLPPIFKARPPDPEPVNINGTLFFPDLSNTGFPNRISRVSVTHLKTGGEILTLELLSSLFDGEIENLEGKGENKVIGSDAEDKEKKKERERVSINLGTIMADIAWDRSKDHLRAADKRSGDTPRIEMDILQINPLPNLLHQISSNEYLDISHFRQMITNLNQTKCCLSLSSDNLTVCNTKIWSRFRTVLKDFFVIPFNKETDIIHPLLQFRYANLIERIKFDGNAEYPCTLLGILVTQTVDPLPEIEKAYEPIDSDSLQNIALPPPMPNLPTSHISSKKHGCKPAQTPCESGYITGKIDKVELMVDNSSLKEVFHFLEDLPHGDVDYRYLDRIKPSDIRAKKTLPPKKREDQQLVKEQPLESKNTKKTQEKVADVPKNVVTKTLEDNGVPNFDELLFKVAISLKTIEEKELETQNKPKIEDEKLIKTTEISTLPTPLQNIISLLQPQNKTVLP